MHQRAAGTGRQTAESKEGEAILITVHDHDDIYLCARCDDLCMCLLFLPIPSSADGCWDELTDRLA